ncbi:response regulator [Thiopseudomonas alkaliphila]|uniref:histidine kinase n=1 Tax=Thiopseudomonas alkaliphila TaxID=1697053 RepID=A0AAW7DNW6_9GAMM|nr:ATP-binding protein [Thiopseudomonas alkaliphila]MDM1695469.1 response regulator [Thiopseudomonas alkaliphila]
MLSRLNLKSRVLYFTLLPAALLAMSLGVGFIWVLVNQAEAQLMQRSYIIAEQTARLSNVALAQKDTETLHILAQQILGNHDVRAVHFHDAHGNPIVKVGPATQHKTSYYSSSLQIVSGYQYSMLILPIYPLHTEPLSAAPIDQPLGWLELEVSHIATLLDSYRIGLITLIIILLGLAISGFLAARFAEKMIKPLRAITHNISQISAGDLSTRIAPVGCPDLDQLAKKLNQMFIAIQDAQEDMLNSIEQSTLDIRHNLETIEIQNIELNKARKEAVETSRIKTEFLTSISHEIRTPLNGILGFTSLLKKSELSSRQMNYLDTIQTSAENLLGILNQVLDLSRLEAGKVIFENMPFSLRDILHDTLMLLSTSAHEKQLELIQLVYQDTPNSFIGDPLRLQQVLTNLISNAIKFTHEGHVVIRVMLEDEQEDTSLLRFCIQDTGIGLQENELNSLFEAFQQVQSPIPSHAQGSGLGLSISKHLIEQMGGAIGVNSQPSVGSEFWFTLPLKKSLSDAEPLLIEHLENERVITFEEHLLARQSLHLQLKELQLTPMVADDLEHLVQQVQQAKKLEVPIRYAILAISTRNYAPQVLKPILDTLSREQCFTLVICSTTELDTYQSHLTDYASQIFHKPIALRQIQQLFYRHSTQAESTPHHRLSHAPQPTAVGRSLNIMCVDDNAANLTFISTLLREMNLNVMSFADGWSALEAFKVNTPDLVLMDIKMPGLDGKQTMHKMRVWEKEVNRSQTPIVAVTAHAFIEERRDLKQRGFNDFITKPVNEQTLIQLILTWTGHWVAPPKPQPLSPPAPANPTTQLAVFDFSESIQLAGGRKKLALDLLELLLDSLPADRSFIQQAFSESLLERVHRLHGATKYCGVPQLRAQCKLCETLLKTPGANIDQEIKLLDQCIERVMIECRGKINPLNH